LDYIPNIAEVRHMESESSTVSTINFDNPKAAPVVLAVGAGIWRFISYLSNIDFILSVREERIAVVLELLLDYGWILLIVAGVVWFLGANKVPRDTSKVHWGMVTAVGIVAFMFGVLVSVAGGAGGALPQIITQWGGDQQGCNAQIDASRLGSFKSKYRVILICGISDSKIDSQEDTRIAVSSPFNIISAPSSLVIYTPLGPMSDAIKSAPQTQAIQNGQNGQPNQQVIAQQITMWHSVALIPVDGDVSEIKRVSDVERHGGRIIAEPPAGGFGNLITIITPQIQTPPVKQAPKRGRKSEASKKS
jgi:hypothetical protein